MSKSPLKLIGLIGLSCTTLCLVAAVLPAIATGALGLSLGSTEFALGAVVAAGVAGALLRRRAKARACNPQRTSGC